MNWYGLSPILVVFSLVLIIAITLYATRAIPIVTRLAQISTFLAPVFLTWVLLYLPTAFLLLPVTSLLPRNVAVFLNTIAPISCALWLAWVYARDMGLFDRSRWSSELRLWVAVFFSGIGHLGPIGYISYQVSSAHYGRPNGAPLFLLTIIAYGLSFLLTIRFLSETVDAEGMHRLEP